RAERRGHVEPAREVAVEPVGQRDDDEQHRGQQVLQARLELEQEHADDQRDRDDASPGQQGRQVAEPRPACSEVLRPACCTLRSAYSWPSVSVSSWNLPLLSTSQVSV